MFNISGGDKQRCVSQESVCLYSSTLHNTDDLLLDTEIYKFDFA